MLAEFGDQGEAQAASSDQAYFQSYGDISVHELMIKDKPRTLAYKNFIENNEELFKGKVVLDVGAGTGILSLFAAKAGAKTVYAVEASGIADMCEDIVKANDYENTIKVIKNVIEKVELPEKVDVIISEWMGFYLLHESMLDSVIHARDKWLKDDGILLPSHASLYCAPVNMSEYYKENFEYWQNVYGFNFSPFLEQSVQKTFTQPAVTIVKPDQCLSKTEIVAEFNLKTITRWDVQDVEKKLTFQMENNCVLHGFATWFDVRFSVAEKCHPSGDGGTRPHETPSGKKKTTHSKENNFTGASACSSNITDTTSDIRDTAKDTSAAHRTNMATEAKTLTLDTGPKSPPTHWKQTVCFIPASVSLSKGEIIHCKISLDQDEGNRRHYNMSLELIDSLDSEDNTDDNDYDDEEDGPEHPVPCDCDNARCRIIKALTEKYDEEQNELEMEAEFVDVTAEVQAAQTMDNDSSCLDSEHLSESATNDDSYSKD